MRRLQEFFAVSLALVVLSGCGGGSSDPPPAPLTVTASSPPAGTAGTVYVGYTFAASGAPPPFTWTASGSLPPGLTVSASGQLSGTPTRAGRYPFTVTVTDSSISPQAGAAQVSLQVNDAAIVIAPANPPAGTITSAYPGFGFSASGGSPPYTWKASGTLPPGMTFGSDGTVSGTPTQTGTFAFSVTATDSAQQPMSSAALATQIGVGPLVTLSISPESVLAGQPATLTWSSLGAATCSASGAWAGTQATSGQASTSPVYPGGSDSYVLSCADSMGNIGTTTSQLSVECLLADCNAYSRTQLVANISGAAHNTDPGLLNPWGIAFPANHAAVVANNQGNTSTSYDGTGATQSPGTGMNTLAIQLPAGAGGVAFNPTGVVAAPAGMTVTAAGKSGPAQLIYAGESGMIAAWAPTVDPANAIVVYADKGGAVYKSLAVAGNHLYAADFHNNKIDVFDLTFAKQSGYPFIDPTLPTGYAPYGLYVPDPGGIIYVAYAMQLAPANHDAVAGAGLGVISVFNVDGSFSQRLTSGGPLNAPGAMALFPATAFVLFGGIFSAALIVANTGDGTINGFYYDGAYAGALRDASGTTLTITGLHSIAIGNRYANQPDFALFYTAGTSKTGTFGRIDWGAAPRLHAPPNLSVTMSGPDSQNNYDITVDTTSAVGIALLDLQGLPPLPPVGYNLIRYGYPAPFHVQYPCGPPCGGVSATVADVDGNIATANATPP